MEKLNSEASLQDAEAALQETLARLKETEQMEERAAKSSQEEEKADTIMEPSPQSNLGSYYNFLEAGKIIPKKFTVPLFVALEEERVRTHTWMKIAKSKGVVDIGPLEENLKETQRELARVRHVESSQQAKLLEENELLRQQLQLQGQRKEEDTTAKDTIEEPQVKEGMQAELEALNWQLQEMELQASLEIQSLK